MKCLLALLLMGGGSMMAQDKLSPMVSSYVQQAKTRRAAAAEEQKPGLFMVRVQPNANPDEVSGQIAGMGAEDGTAVTLYNLSGTIVRQSQVTGGAVSLDGLQPGVYAVQIGRLGSTLIRL